MAVSDEERPAGGDVVDGVVDYKGRPARRSRSGYWKSASFIIGAGVNERFAYFGISSNLINYFTGPLGQSTAAAAANVNTWAGTGALLPLLGAFIADSFLGQYWTIVVSSLLYILALGLLTLSATTFICDRDATNTQTCPSQLQSVLFFSSLYLVAFSQAAHRPCIVAFGADQFDGQHPLESRSKSSFFNWWYFGICAGPLMALMVLNYIQDNLSWALGFGIPCIAVAVSLALFLLGSKSYRYTTDKADERSPVSRIWALVVKAARNWQAIHSESVDEEGSLGSPPRLCSKRFEYLEQSLLEPDGRAARRDIIFSEIKEAKELLKLIPIWFTSLGYAIVNAQTYTFFTEQGITMDRAIAPGIEVPAASLQYLIGVSIIVFIPIYDRVVVPIGRAVAGNPSGITKLQRVGIGMVLSSITMIIAGFVEKRRIQTALDHGLIEFPKATIPMSFWWLLPQYILFGIADVFTGIGLQELFYDQVPCHLKCVGLSFFISIFGIGNFLSSFIISGVEALTSKDGSGSGSGGWFSDNLNQGHLDYFYWLLAGISSAGLVAFIIYAKSFKVENRNSGN